MKPFVHVNVNQQALSPEKQKLMTKKIKKDLKKIGQKRSIVTFGNVNVYTVQK